MSKDVLDCRVGCRHYSFVDSSPDRRSFCSAVDFDRNRLPGTTKPTVPALCVGGNSLVPHTLCWTKVPEQSQHNSNGANLPCAEAISLKPYRSRRNVPDVATLVGFKRRVGIATDAAVLHPTNARSGSRSAGVQRHPERTPRIASAASDHACEFDARRRRVAVQVRSHNAPLVAIRASTAPPRY